MLRKALAAFLLLVIAAWAEMTMAPMIAMHAGHMRPGHEMAADMPSNHALPHAGHHHAEHQAMAEGRPCCPVLHKIEPTEALEVASGSPACDDPHSCCFRQGPQSVPAPARDVQKFAREMAPAALVEIIPVRGAGRRSVQDNSPILSPPPEVFGMILRV
jgi:hypothetical protein